MESIPSAQQKLFTRPPSPPPQEGGWNNIKCNPKIENYAVEVNKCKGSLKDMWLPWGKKKVSQCYANARKKIAKVKGVGLTGTKGRRKTKQMSSPHVKRVMAS